jgi:hypothetical protein
MDYGALFVSTFCSTFAAKDFLLIGFDFFLFSFSFSFFFFGVGAGPGQVGCVG